MAQQGPYKNDRDGSVRVSLAVQFTVTKVSVDALIPFVGNYFET